MAVNRWLDAAPQVAVGVAEALEMVGQSAAFALYRASGACNR